MAQDAEHVERKKFLRTVPIFTSLSEREISRIADRMQKVTISGETFRPRPRSLILQGLDDYYRLL